MARDAKQVFRFLTVAQNNTNNQLQQQNYLASTTVLSSGAVMGFNSAGGGGLWSQGISNTINRAGFRNTNADQSIIISGETSGILNDPALVANTNSSERYCHVTVAPFGAHVATVRFEVLVEGASDSGTGTASTDWSAISSAIPVTVNAGQTRTVVFSGGQGTATAHALNVGDVLIPRANGGGFSLLQPLFVVGVTGANTFLVSKTPGSAVQDATITQASATYDLCHQRRILAIPIAPNPKPWVRVIVRAIPTGNVTPAANVGVLVDNAFLTMGRDSASLF
jgi:hypothetical protein